MYHSYCLYSVNTLCDTLGGCAVRDLARSECLSLYCLTPSTIGLGLTAILITRSNPFGRALIISIYLPYQIRQRTIGQFVSLFTNFALSRLSALISPCFLP